jgi:hypothetical protein
LPGMGETLEGWRVLYCGVLTPINFELMADSILRRAQTKGWGPVR